MKPIASGIMPPGSPQTHEVAARIKNSGKDGQTLQQIFEGLQGDSRALRMEIGEIGHALTVLQLNGVIRGAGVYRNATTVCVLIRNGKGEERPCRRADGSELVGYEHRGGEVWVMAEHAPDVFPAPPQPVIRSNRGPEPKKFRPRPVLKIEAPPPPKDGPTDGRYDLF